MSERYKHKLDGPLQLKVIELLALYYTNQYILDYMKREYGIELDSTAISYYKRKHADEIEKQRRKYLETLPVMDKAYRQAIRQMLIDDILRRGLWYEQPGRYGSVLKGNHAVINQILDSAAKEFEKDDPESSEAILTIKAMLKLRGKAAEEFVLTGRMPSLEEMKELVARRSIKPLLNSTKKIERGKNES